MSKIIRFVGSSGSGKTTLIAGVVRQLVARHRSVAVIKHAHHDVEVDVEGKDSFAFAQAGARLALVASSEKVAIFEAASGDGDRSLEDLARRVPQDVDVVLAEGFHEATTPYFHVFGRGDGVDGRALSGELLGHVPMEFTRDDATGAAATVASRIICWLDDHAAERRLDELLREAEEFHGHLCPGQILGVRMAMLGAASVGLPEPRGLKALVVWVEIDRCGADAVQTVTGCRPGKRSLKLVDHGKLAATFLNTRTGAAIRVVARADSRERAAELYPDLERKAAQSLAYRTLPLAELFDTHPVAIELDEYDRPGKPLVRVLCSRCGEEVNDGRHTQGDDGPLCRACAGETYYRALQPALGELSW